MLWGLRQVFFAFNHARHFMSFGKALGAETQLNGEAGGKKKPGLQAGLPQMTRKQQENLAVLLESLAKSEKLQHVSTADLINDANKFSRPSKDFVKSLQEALWANYPQQAAAQDAAMAQTAAGQKNGSPDRQNTNTSPVTNPLQNPHATPTQQAAELVKQMEELRVTMNVDPTHTGIAMQVTSVEKGGSLTQMREVLAIMKCYQEMPGFIGGQDVCIQTIGNTSPTILEGPAGDKAIEFRAQKEAAAITTSS